MWEKINKEQINSKFQRLIENEHNLSLTKYVGCEKNIKTKLGLRSILWRSVLGILGILFVFLPILYVTYLTKNHSFSFSWRTSTRIRVSAYTETTLSKADTTLLRESEEQVEHNKVVSCYYNMPEKSERNQLMPENIHPNLCTHINVAFARIVNKEIALDNYQYESLRYVVSLKKNNPNLKILLSIGGSGNDSGFSDMVVNHASRKVFIKSIKSILRNYTLDGVDLDWEFPGLQQKLGGSRERQHFSQLLREIRMEFIREKRPYILTIAAAAPETIVSISYDIDQVNQYVDFVNIMTYDYHFYSKYTPFTGFNSPLYSRSTEQMYMATLNINYTIHMYIDKGLDRNKIVVGIPTYGHTYTLVNPNNTRVGSPASGFGSLGGSGFVNYPDVCTFLKSFNDVSLKEDKDAKVPYMYRHKEWVSYDSPQSVIEKAQFIKYHNLRGAMIYSLNADDYAGICNTKLESANKFPLSESVKNTLIT